MVQPNGKKKKSHRAIAQEWLVSPLTVQHWQDKGFPIQDHQGLARALAKGHTSQLVRARALEVLKGFANVTQSDETVFQAEMKVRRNALEAVEDLERYQAYFKSLVEQGQKTGNDAMIENAIKKYAELSLVQIRVRKELHKMGEESGNTIAKGEMKRVVQAFGSRLAMGVHRAIEQLSVKLVGAVDVEEAASRIEPVLVLSLIMEPFKAAAGLASSVGLPEWVVLDLRETVGDHVEDGEKEFDKAEAA